MFLGAFIQLVGPWLSNNFNGSNRADASATLKARHASWGDKNSAFISLHDAPIPQFGTGRIGAPTANGNSDFYTGVDINHPSVMGKWFLQDWLESRIDANLVAAGF